MDLFYYDNLSNLCVREGKTKKLSIEIKKDSVVRDIRFDSRYFVTFIIFIYKNTQLRDNSLKLGLRKEDS